MFLNKSCSLYKKKQKKKFKLQFSLQGPASQIFLTLWGHLLPTRIWKHAYACTHFNVINRCVLCFFVLFSSFNHVVALITYTNPTYNTQKKTLLRCVIHLFICWKLLLYTAEICISKRCLLPWSAWLHTLFKVTWRLMALKSTPFKICLLQSHVPLTQSKNDLNSMKSKDPKVQLEC